MPVRPPARPKVAFGADQAVERIEKHQGRPLPIVRRQFAFKLFDGKPKSIAGDVGFIGKLVGDTSVIG
jgi:hypothetical protein